MRVTLQSTHYGIIKDQTDVIYLAQSKTALSATGATPLVVPDTLKKHPCPHALRPNKIGSDGPVSETLNALKATGLDRLLPMPATGEPLIFQHNPGIAVMVAAMYGTTLQHVYADTGFITPRSIVNRLQLTNLTPLVLKITAGGIPPQRLDELYEQIMLSPRRTILTVDHIRHLPWAHRAETLPEIEAYHTDLFWYCANRRVKEILHDKTTATIPGSGFISVNET